MVHSFGQDNWDQPVYSKRECNQALGSPAKLSPPPFILWIKVPYTKFFLRFKSPRYQWRSIRRICIKGLVDDFLLF
jgi:hypothetical protein